MPHDDDSSPLRLTVLAVRDKSILFDYDGEEAWIPRSLVYRGAERARKGIEDVFEIYDWKLRDVGWL